MADNQKPVEYYSIQITVEGDIPHQLTFYKSLLAMLDGVKKRIIIKKITHEEATPELLK